MAQLTQFNGGLVTRVAPHLLGVTQAVTNVNVDMSAGSLRPLKGPATTGAATGAYSYWFRNKNQWLSSSIYRDYLEFQGKLIYTDGVKPKIYDGATERNLGVIAPTMAPSTALAGGSLTGTYQYAYSYYNDQQGIESSISPLTPELTLANNQVVLTLTPSTDPQVSNIRLYRIGGIWTDFLLVTTLPNTATPYYDNLADQTLQGRLIGNVSNTAPRNELRFVCERQGTFFGAVDDKLYYTKGDGQPYYWPNTFYINVFEPVTALASCTSGIYVFTATSVFILTGNDSTSFALVTLSRSQGCLSAASLVYVNDSVIFGSNDGICVASGANVVVISQVLLTKEAFNITRACLHDDVYYAQLANGTVLMYDMRFGSVKFSYLSCSSTDIYTGADKLYVTVASSRKELSGTALSYTYKTGKLTEGQISNLKTYNKFYLAVDGTVTVKLYLDGALANEQVCSTGTTELAVPQHMREAYYFEVEFTGTGEVQELYYNVMPRQM